jgi:hypothetical protein
MMQPIHETEVEKHKQKIEAMNFRHLIDELCVAEGESEAELLRIAKKWVRLRKEEIEEFLDETMEGKQ